MDGRARQARSVPERSPHRVHRIRLHHRRRGFGRLRAGEPAQRGRDRDGARRRGRRRGLVALHPYAERLGDRHGDEEHQLELPHRARAGPGRAAHHLPARQGRRGLLLHQRHGLHPRQRDGLRELGAGRRPWLGLCGRAALFQARRDAGGGCRRLPRWGRPAAHELRLPGEPAVLRLRRGRAAGRLSRHRGRERLPAGRVRPHGPHHPQGRALERGPRLPRRGPQATQPDAMDPMRGRADHLFGAPGHRPRLPAQGPARGGDGATRGDPGGRRHQLAPTPHAVRHRAGRAPRPTRDPRRGGPSRRRPEPDRPPRVLFPGRLPGTDHALRHDGPPAQGDDRRAMAADPRGPGRHQPLRELRLHPLARRRARGPTSSTISCRPPSRTTARTSPSSTGSRPISAPCGRRAAAASRSARPIRPTRPPSCSTT